MRYAESYYGSRPSAEGAAPGRAVVRGADRFYRKDLKDTLVELGTTLSGLDEGQVEERLALYGPNRLPEGKRTPAWRLFLGQFTEPLMLLLLGSAAVSYLVGKTKDAVGIFVATLLNCTLGFYEEYMSQRSVESLKRMSSEEARALRGGHEVEVAVASLVPGDIVLLGEGDRVPADARLVEAHSLRVDESSLTGESVPVPKSIDAIGDDRPLSERANMVYMSTSVAGGRALAVVVATGEGTEIGRIARIVGEGEEPTPLQRQIDELAKRLGVIAVVVCMLFFVLSLMAGRPLVDVFSTSVSLAVASIPEGLPTVLTVTLALGMRRMAEKRAIVKRLPAVETLGCTTVICSDKTGTLTHNRMTVRRVLFDGRTYTVTGDGLALHGDFFRDPNGANGRPGAPARTARIKAGAYFLPGLQDVAEKEELARFAEIGFLCNDASVADGEALGDPTEASLKVLGYKAGLDDSMARRKRRVDEVPFSSENRFMLTVNYEPATDGTTTNVKGAVDVLLAMCDRALVGGREVPLDDAVRRLVAETNAQFCGQALRVLAFAYGSGNRKDDRRGLVFAGLAGMIDPPRAEVADAIAQCKQAGIRVVMITGDQRDTAVAIARELGILDGEGCALTGAELDRMPDERFAEVVASCNVFSRVSPEHKVRILMALKGLGGVVAMTGDGVNDAPALSRADIGVSMAITGTDVAKETADMVLADDNFATIVGAVREGRTIYSNIRKFLRFQLTANIAALTLMFASTAMNLPSPLSPIQILLINIVMDGPPALALGVEPASKHVMRQPPRPPKEQLLSMRIVVDVLVYGLFIAAGCLYIFREYLLLPGSSVAEVESLARTAVFALFVLFQLFLAFGSRTHRTSVFSTSFWSNRWLLASVAASAAMLGAVVLTDAGAWLGISRLPLEHAARLTVIASSVFFLTEARKAVSRFRRQAFD